MNDITQTLLRSILKIGAGAAIAHGLVSETESETVIAALIALIGVVWGLLHRAPSPASANAVKITNAPILLLLATLALAPGCATAPTTAAYRAEGVVIQTVDTGMKAWSDYVRAG